MQDSMFRDLNEQEIAEFKQWARENHKPFATVSELWHPIVRLECNLMDDEETHRKHRLESCS